MTRSSLATIAFVLGLLPSACLAQGEPATAAGPAGGDIHLELNKLQQVDSSCDTFFVVRNNTATDIDLLSIKAYLFDGDGIIIVTPVLYSFAGLPAGRSKVYSFNLRDLQCDRIGRWLVNEVVDCNSAAEIPIEGCADLITTSSRSDVVLEY
jgi:hypothetical protein